MEGMDVESQLHALALHNSMDMAGYGDNTHQVPSQMDQFTVVKPKLEPDSLEESCGGAVRNSTKPRTRRHKPKEVSDLVCGICGDRALGYNFDAVTCESCKAFFRRNAHKSKDLKCSFEGCCKLDPHTRKFCSSCRLKKCLSIGMKKDWILDDSELARRRDRRLQKATGTNRAKQRDSIESPSSTMCSPPFGSGSYSPPSSTGVESMCADSTIFHQAPMENPYMLQAPTQSQSHQQQHNISTSLPMDTATSTSCSSLSPPPPTTNIPAAKAPSPDLTPQDYMGDASQTELKTVLDAFLESQLPQHTRQLLPEENARLDTLVKGYYSVFDLPYKEQETKNFKPMPSSSTEMFNMTDVFIRRLIKFAKAIPEFKMLDQEDQITLLKGSVMAVMIMRGAHKFDAQVNGWQYKDSAGTKTLPGMPVMNPGCPDLFKSIREFATTLASLTNGDMKIIILLYALELFSPDRVNVKNKTGIYQAQETYSQLLQKYLLFILPEHEAKQIYPKILMLLVDLRALADKNEQSASQVDMTKMEPLLLEIFNLR
ncbi:unnamed protein product [Owenia fusiformis]|uniref:Uncharacterized protein n=1 Tax=Owenia fusiformis TaxID=6347 RepID=A0A8J1XHX4_OWEFU|nr:unnamed protein product [Owenia fusiformis]